MPRPKVLPSQRRRAAEACNFCRDAKKKCSGTAPCSHCLRRGIASQCTITLRPRGSRIGFTSEASIGTQPHATKVGAQPKALDQQTTRPQPAISMVNLNGQGRRNGSDSSAFRPPSPSDSRPSISASKSPEGHKQHRTSDASSATENPHSRMLLNLRGERGRITSEMYCSCWACPC
jgi:hypothetical protein